MKTLKQIRESYDLITEKEENEERKLTSLVRSGLVDTNKLPLIKRALNKDNKVLTPSERNALMSLLDSLMAQVLNSNPVYQKVKQNVMKEELRPATTRMSDMPSILVLKRKAIRVYPGGQNVGLYYSQQLDKYVAVPFGGSENKNILSMTEEEQLDEISNKLATKVLSRRMAQANDEDESDLNRNIAAYKVGKTMVNRIATKGLIASARMDDKAKKFSNRYKSMKKAKKAKANANNATPKPVAPKKPNVDMNVMNSSTLADAIKHRSVAHVIGGMAYRSMNKSKLKEEQQVDEAYGLVARAAVAGVGAVAKRYGPTILKGIKNLVKGKGKKPANKKPPTKQDRLKNLDKNRQRNRDNRKKRDFDTPENQNNQDANTNSGDNAASKSPQVKTSPTGGASKLAVTVRKDVFDADRNTRYNKTLNTQQPQRPNAMMQRESVNLDGNTFELNSSVAKKVQSVYESLNKKNKKKMVDMMNESEESFNKVISFVVRH